MRVDSLEVVDFRNLQPLRLACAPGLNLIIGANAAGKTSLLEALYFLGRGRSFRTAQNRELIRRGGARLRVVAGLVEAGGRRVTVGVEHDGRVIGARVAGNPAETLAELARQMPVLLIDAGSHRLLEGGPRERRRFMDWGLFHGESGFLKVWRRYGAALRHRNAALRGGLDARSIDAWDT